jgi:hypothetical protein
VPAELPACPSFAGAVEKGRTPAEVNEASGVVASRRNPGVLWMHNDSGDAARVLAVAPTGQLLGIYKFEGAGALDWEDIAIGPGPETGVTYLYAGDIGDNAAFRPDITIYRVAEPAVDPSSPVSTPQTLPSVERLTLLYPDRAHNAETLLVDPLNGDLYIVTKEDSGNSGVFRAAAPLDPSSEIKMTQVASINFGVAPLDGSKLATGGDISAAGDAIAIRTYDAAFLWRRAPGASIAEAFATEPCLIPAEFEEQGEALGFAQDGSGYYTVSEGKSQAIYFYARK